MRHLALPILLLVLAAPPALADDVGGTAAPSDTVATGRAGGVHPGAGVAPLAQLTVRTPMRQGRPRIRVRFVERGVDSVTARLVVLRSPGNTVAGQIVLGRVPTHRTIAVPWRRAALPPGRYVVRVHAHDEWDNQLRRPRGNPGKASLLVRARPAATPPPAAPAPSGRGVFPIAGPFTYGDGMGADRGTYSHQGQDMAAAAGTPIVAPLAGTIHTTSYQASGAGYYVVLNASNGHAYFFAHCQKGSVAVETGQAVAAGSMLCRVGSTGRSSGPHLHFEEWVDGWRTSTKSKPIDPLPQLTAWAS